MIEFNQIFGSFFAVHGAKVVTPVGFTTRTQQKKQGNFLMMRIFTTPLPTAHSIPFTP
jgi:hypothetical protein